MTTEKFKFVFDDAQTSLIDAPTHREAAILVAANRIRAKKNFHIIGAWCKNKEDNTWEKIKINSISIQLGN